MVGSSLRVRANGSSVSCMAWAPAYKFFLQQLRHQRRQRLCLRPPAPPAACSSGTNPPVQDQGDQSDGVITWTYLHDGAGIIQITAVTDSSHVTGTVLHTVPLK